MKKLSLFWLLSLVITALSSSFISSIELKAAFIPQKMENIFNSVDTTYHIISALENTYGYEILVKNKIFIRQLSIPGKSGTQGFKSKADAEKVAQLVLKKLSKGIMPPTVDEKELIKLKIKL